MLIPLTEYAKRLNKNSNTARRSALRGAFKTAVKMGRDWFIEENEPWIDHRETDKSKWIKD